MKELIHTIESLKNSDIKTKVDKRIREFKNINRHSSDDVFKELCFCILTANFNADRGMHIHQQLSTCFASDSEEVLEKKFRQHGYRFPHIRATYIAASAERRHELIKTISALHGEELRDWLVKNIQGLGYKEASHFLRNIGYDTYAIIDSHILDLLQRYQLIAPLKTLTKKKYLETEKILQGIASQTQLTLAELDLYLWYLETGKILK
jgi:N-glycosylase/DNA lyase